MDFLLIFKLLITLAAAGVSLCTVFGFLGRWWWRFDLFSHFRVQYTVLLGGAILMLSFLGEISLVLVFVLFELLNLWLIAPLYFKRSQRMGSKTYRLLLINVLQENQQYDKVLKLVQDTDPDFVALIETGEHWIEALTPLQSNYPYFQYEFWGEENYDIAFFSRISSDSLEVHRFGPTGVPTIVARFVLDSQNLIMIATHPAPPKTSFETEARNAQMRALASFVAIQKGTVILAGDLNMTSWSPFFGDFLHKSNLRDSRLGMGIQASWPADSPFLRVPIDHILISTGVQVAQRFLTAKVGSDHRPVVMDFSLL